MANARSNSIGPRLTNAEQVAGFLYLPFYVALLSVGLRHLNGLLGLSLTDLQLNTCWFVLNTLFVGIIFHKFLARSFRSIRFWELVQAVILGFALYYAANWVFAWITSLLEISIVSFNGNTIRALATDNFWVMAACSVVLAPVVEETLVRGLIFGTIRPRSRVAAYVVSMLFFSLMHEWAYISTEGIVPVLLAAAQYIPASIALGWTYEKANSIWAPIFLHMIINAITMGLM